MLCGDNSGQHMYVDVRGRSETNLNILSMPVFPKPVGVHNETNSSRWPESASTMLKNIWTNSQKYLDQDHSSVDERD